MTVIKKNHNEGSVAAIRKQDQGAVAEFLMDVRVHVTVEVGSVHLPVGEILKLQPGQLVALNSDPSASLKVFVDGKLFALGEAVIVNNKVGLQITEIVGRSITEAKSENSRLKTSA